MPEKAWVRIAVMLVLLREGKNGQEVLLQRRQNTGYGDGMLECAACGHVDMGEGMRTAMAREAKEELGIDIEPADLHFFTQLYKYTAETGDTYINTYFTVEKYTGEPRIAEPYKCSELDWFSLNNLPHDLLPDRRIALQNGLIGISYNELGWEDCK